jgi:hypothetical protein
VSLFYFSLQHLLLGSTNTYASMPSLVFAWELSSHLSPLLFSASALAWLNVHYYTCSYPPLDWPRSVEHMLEQWYYCPRRRQSNSLRLSRAGRAKLAWVSSPTQSQKITLPGICDGRPWWAETKRNFGRYVGACDETCTRLKKCSRIIGRGLLIWIGRWLLYTGRGGDATGPS